VGPLIWHTIRQAHLQVNRNGGLTSFPLYRHPYGDQAIFIRKKYFHSTGDFKEIPLMEDVELMRRIKKNGDKIYIIPEKCGRLPADGKKKAQFTVH